MTDQAEGERPKQNDGLDEKFWNLTTCCIATAYVFIALYSQAGGGFTNYAGKVNAFFFVIGSVCLISSIVCCCCEVSAENDRFFASWAITIFIILLNIPIAMTLLMLDYSGLQIFLEKFWEGLWKLDFSSVR